MLANMNIGTRLILTFGLMLVFQAVVGIVSTIMLERLAVNVTALSADRMPKVGMAHGISDNININARVLRNIIVSDKKTQAGELKRIVDPRQLIDDHLRQLQIDVHSEKGKQLLGDIVVARGVYTQRIDEYLTDTRAGEVEQG